MENTNSKRNLLHSSFEFGITLKGIDGVLEVIGGILLMLVSPASLSRIVHLLTQHELAEDPKDIIANFLLGASQGFSVSFQSFGVFYLLSHGAVKLFLVIMLMRRKLWAYPLTIVFLVLFIAYQIYRYAYSHSAWLIVLTVLDVALIFLTWIEYLRIQRTANS